jgi:hypothetical protein
VCGGGQRVGGCVGEGAVWGRGVWAEGGRCVSRDVGCVVGCS